MCLWYIRVWLICHYVCVCVCTTMHTLSWHMQRQRDTLGVSVTFFFTCSITLCLISLNHGLLLNLELASQPASTINPTVVTSKCWGYRLVYSHVDFFIMFRGFVLMSLCLLRELSYLFESSPQIHDLIFFSLCSIEYQLSLLVFTRLSRYLLSAPFISFPECHFF